MRFIRSCAHQPAIRCPSCGENMFYLRTDREAHWLVCLTCGIKNRLTIPPVRLFIDKHDRLDIISVQPIKN